ncbi:hypothetical protein G7054_g13322 [Neopestalotiopsis clavispora]|nr:hypothetical protein G7054_g13322 [Neopestalotiopsis clavispora]
MPEAKASSGPNSDGPNVQTRASGGNAKASATSTDDQGGRWTETSTSKGSGVGAFVERVLGFSSKDADGNDEGEEGDWDIVKKSKTADKKSSSSGDGAYATAGGRASAGIVDGKAVASTK